MTDKSLALQYYNQTVNIAHETTFITQIVTFREFKESLQHLLNQTIPYGDKI